MFLDLIYLAALQLQRCIYLELLKDGNVDLTKYNDLVTKTFKEANELSKADFWNQIKKQLGVVTISDMAKKLDMNINTVYISYYKGESYEPFITKMNEHGWTFSIKDAQIKLIRR